MKNNEKTMKYLIIIIIINKWKQYNIHINMKNENEKKYNK
jgi:hypothetical protein